MLEIDLRREIAKSKAQNDVEWVQLKEPSS